MAKDREEFEKIKASYFSRYGQKWDTAAVGHTSGWQDTYAQGYIDGSNAARASYRVEGEELRSALRDARAVLVSVQPGFHKSADNRWWEINECLERIDPLLQKLEAPPPDGSDADTGFGKIYGALAGDEFSDLDKFEDYDKQEATPPTPCAARQPSAAETGTGGSL